LNAGPIYLDHNATTPLLPEVRAAMARALEELWGNPSSVHGPGRRARAAVEDARQEVAALVGGDREEIVFTSGGTEADHLGIRGLADDRPHGQRVSSRLEHPAVHGALAAAGRAAGAAAETATSWVPVDAEGRIAPEALAETLRPDAALVSLALVNHELGNLYPVTALAAAARSRAPQVRVHTDAVQAAGRIAIDVRALGVDALSLSAHKLGGPKGVGALWIRQGLLPAPLLAGGHQERERRAGTENVPGIVGFGEAARRARQDLTKLPDRITRVAALRDRLEARLLQLPGSRRHGDPGARAPGTVNIGFEGAAGQLVVIGLDLEGVAVSSGAACSSGTLAPSPVLLALGLPPARAREAVRFSLGPDNTAEEIDRAAALVATVVARVRAAS
jgi:cysteine desulfurase